MDPRKVQPVGFPQSQYAPIQAVNYQPQMVPGYPGQQQVPMMPMGGQPQYVPMMPMGGQPGQPFQTMPTQVQYGQPQYVQSQQPQFAPGYAQPMGQPMPMAQGPIVTMQPGQYIPICIAMPAFSGIQPLQGGPRCELSYFCFYSRV
jgi:hypothetical protein